MSARRTFILKRQWFISSRAGDIQEFYTLERELGRGAYGMVFLGYDIQTNSPRAIKQIQKDQVREHTAFLAEMDALRKLVIYMQDHPNIIKLIETVENETFCYLVMEYCSGGELFSRVQNKQHISEADTAQIMRSLFGAVAYCHSQGICHRDIKPENCVFVDNSQGADIKLIDFGLAKEFTEEEVLHSVNGTPYYIAPEMLTGNYTYMVDCWSLGVIMYILLSGVPPFNGKNNQEILMRVYSGSFTFKPRAFREVSAQAKDLISKLLIKDPSLRMNSYQAIQHPWVQGLAPIPETPLPRSISTSLADFTSAQNLKRASLIYIASRMSFKDLEYLSPIFKSIDTDNDGVISEHELFDALQKQGIVSNYSEFQNFSAGLDANQNGMIDYSEFVSACIYNQRYLNQGILKAAFEYFDRDKNGWITVGELREALKMTEMVNNGTDISLMIQEADIDGDGRIDYMEFLHMMVHRS